MDSFPLITFKFEYEIRFSREFTIQYITMLFMCECNQILFHMTPHHNGFPCKKQILSQFKTQTLIMNPKVNVTVVRHPVRHICMPVNLIIIQIYIRH